MQDQGRQKDIRSLDMNGIRNANTVWWDLSTPALYEHSLQRHEGLLAHLGPLVVRTGQYTGRSPNDRFIVREGASQEHIWWGNVNREFDPSDYDKVRARLTAYLQGKDLYVQDCYCGTDPQYRLPIRIINELAWHNIFARNMFVKETDRAKLSQYKPEFTLIDAPGFVASPSEDRTNSEAFILLSFERKEVIIGGTGYGGEMKKSFFAVMNYLLPQRGVLSMHCSANYGKDRDDVAIFFGLSGTGKTTLSADPNRTLVGDDEHGWSDDGVFNFEGGCYAKVIKLSPTGEPEIYATTRRFGTILENVAIDSENRHIDLDSSEFTENTRASYPVTHIPNADPSGLAGHPKTIIMLTCDAFGVLPPVAKLSPAQAMYHFLSGYTAKVAGTERGITEPQAAFSTCFGAPFMALNPNVYAKLLGEKMAKHKANAYLINTGWSGGPYGVGSRMKLSYTRAMVTAALTGALEAVPVRRDENFGLDVPTKCPGVPDEVLDPKSTWDDKAAYDAQAKKLAGMFNKNFKHFESDASDEVKAAGPAS